MSSKGDIYINKFNITITVGYIAWYRSIEDNIVKTKQPFNRGIE